ncbi:hypothetical protein ACFXPX_34390 [Kitasatospora sp. NPDC059146]|uniref:hypothetical protein n=1 Tax=unclassified Kitasatospora TaxID=2633591 RepID=UPI0036764520
MQGYGRTELEWNELAEAAHDHLAEVARAGGLTTYTKLSAALVERTGQPGFDFSRADHRAAVGYLLWRVTTDGRTGQEPMLSALVRYEGMNDAGPGFYGLAQELGLLSLGASRAEKDTFWSGQVGALHTAYARPGGPA